VSDPVPLCAQAARVRGDSLAGTAAPASSWLLVEHPGPWEPNALAGAGLGPQVLRATTHRVRTDGWRVLLVRRTGRQDQTRPRGWWLLRGPRPGAPAGGLVASGTWAEPADLLAATAVPEDAPARPADETVPRLLVCTHGRHDTCCAVRGRPVVEALAARWPDAAWECTHLGGDRFAANVLVVPDGTTYGAVDDTDPVRLLGDHLAGRVDPEHLRGWAHLHPWEQAAAVQVHREQGPLPLGAVRVDPARTEHVVASQHWRVHLEVGTAGLGARDVGAAEQVLDVHAEAAPPARLTCRAGSAAAAVRYRVALSPR
jgi:hypothetical protein